MCHKLTHKCNSSNILTLIKYLLC